LNVHVVFHKWTKELKYSDGEDEGNELSFQPMPN